MAFTNIETTKERLTVTTSQPPPLTDHPSTINPLPFSPPPSLLTF